MNSRKTWPIAMTVAGSDSGGGAGVQADLKTFAALRVHGTCAVTCLTAQNPCEVRAVLAVRPSFLRAQLEAVCAQLPPRAVKTGMLYSAELIRAVAEFRFPDGPPLIVDPVMVATSGAPLLQRRAMRALTTALLPRATLITPNLHEAELLLEARLRSVEDLREAARTLHRRFGAAVLVKGGHLGRLQQAVDLYYDGRTELLLEAPRIRGLHTHGTGCTYAAAIAAYVARGVPLPRAVTAAKHFITRALARAYRAAGHDVLWPGA
jgi:hydroxymethylpyrimidine/phosphomethylpyrimidine kinase